MSPEKPGVHAARRAKGYIYVTAEDGGPMATARTSATIRNAGRGPPFIVVSHQLSSVVATRWPGRLWCVEVVDPATATDQAAVAGPPVPSAQYTRAVAVQVGEELPASMLFGPNGDAISTIIDAARELNAEQAAKLSASRHPEAARAYNRVWDAWHRDRGMPGTLASPINSGFTVLYNELLRRAALLSGNAATETDGDDTWLVDPWRGAGAALLEAALALGAPSLAGSADGEILTLAWVAVRG